MFKRKRNLNKKKFEAKEIMKELYKDVDEGKKEFNIGKLDMKKHIEEIKKIPQKKVFGKDIGGGRIKEFHANFKTNKGTKRAQFCGPGTNISTRILRGDRGLGGRGHTDRSCVLHDLDYRRASTDEELLKSQKIVITQQADKDLLNGVKRNNDYFMNKVKIKFAMKLKGLSEGLTLVSQDKYIGKKIDRKIKNAFDYSDDLFNEINKIDEGNFMKSLIKLPKKDFEIFFIELHNKKLSLDDIIKIN